MESMPPSTQPVISRNRWLIHLMLISGYILVVGLLGYARRGTHTAILSQTVSGLILTCALELIIFGLVFGLACFASRATLDDLLLRWKGNLKPVLWGAGYSIALRIACALLIGGIGFGLMVTRIMSEDSFKNFVLNNRPDVGAIIDMPMLRDNPAYFWLMLTLVSFVVAGLREELWRSAFLAGVKVIWPQYFSSRAGQILAVTICAALFGLGHLAMGPMAVGLAGFIGVGLGLIMIFHGSIWPAVIAHGIFDATTFAMLSWAMTHTAPIPS